MGQIAATESFIKLHGLLYVQGTSISVEQEEGKAKNTTRYVMGPKDAMVAGELSKIEQIIEYIKVLYR